MSSRPDIKSEEWDLSLIPDLTGKIALVTGANSSVGIGWNIAHQLALKGAKVYFGARNLDKAENAIAEVKKTSPSIPNGNLAPFVADMTDYKQIKTSADALVSREERLDILINNAGVLPRPLDLDKHGISVSLSINHLAPFALTVALLPLLKKTAAKHPGVRIVTLSSATHTTVPQTARYDSVEAFNNDFGGTDNMEFNYVRYGYSKLANILFAKHLQKKLDSDGIAGVSLAVHPGAVKTDGAVQFAGEQVHLLNGAVTPLQGAITPIYAATASEVWAEKGRYAAGYIVPFGVLSPDEESSLAKDPALAEELWVTSEKVVDGIVAS
ncbi:short-chain dehydrogenase [Dendrothele bispora CBS 962.96]|uniref:Short-chain dehydrogenase n=1 Tax=Dendrothele bispora (strain CBS 962.96) TaxID=1314807 RepID=A0A4V4HDH0_DENBC|nr:short-chain dehydrogenase [Dendrothele bispora CBS 962.96]